MTDAKKPETPLASNEVPARIDGKLDPFLGRIDLLAILIALLGVCLLGIAAIVLVAVELARILLNLWADPFDRWLLVILAASIVWVVARWKKLSVF